jgi:hypothetical protein
MMKCPTPVFVFINLSPENKWLENSNPNGPVLIRSQRKQNVVAEIDMLPVIIIFNQPLICADPRDAVFWIMGDTGDIIIGEHTVCWCKPTSFFPSNRASALSVPIHTVPFSSTVRAEIYSEGKGEFAVLKMLHSSPAILTSPFAVPAHLTSFLSMAYLPT